MICKRGNAEMMKLRQVIVLYDNECFYDRFLTFHTTNF